MRLIVFNCVNIFWVILIYPVLVFSMAAPIFLATSVMWSFHLSHASRRFLWGSFHVLELRRLTLEIVFFIPTIMLFLFALVLYMLCNSKLWKNFFHSLDAQSIVNGFESNIEVLHSLCYHECVAMDCDYSRYRVLFCAWYAFLSIAFFVLQIYPSLSFEAVLYNVSKF